MKKIYILEHFDFNNKQLKRLNALGEVHYFENATETEQKEAVNNADAILLDWLDPNPILGGGVERGNLFVCHIPDTIGLKILTLQRKMV